MTDIGDELATLATDIVSSLKKTDPAPTFAEKLAAFKLLVDYQKMLKRHKDGDDPDDDDDKGAAPMGSAISRHSSKLAAVS